ncbi:hypothetical protein NDU88_002617 [Pleurodeles waltl]|uniref:Uncharacterized protein n=1 Tax=Pleurodeles waltl TaxID=8319 RepID=A0AAV7UA95_PLEWA|nr:hypothetical protein NDU88_002617 [Pleurodeles waltl]
MVQPMLRRTAGLKMRRRVQREAGSWPRRSCGCPTGPLRRARTKRGSARAPGNPPGHLIGRPRCAVLEWRGSPKRTDGRDRAARPRRSCRAGRPLAARQRAPPGTIQTGAGVRTRECRQASADLCVGRPYPTEDGSAAVRAVAVRLPGTRRVQR